MTTDRTTKRGAICIWGIVPAAGYGRRMGQPKQTLPFAGSTVTGTVVRTLLAAGVDGLIVVTRRALRIDLDLPADPRIVVCFNEDADSEMIDSIRLGLRTLEHFSYLRSEPRASARAMKEGSAPDRERKDASAITDDTSEQGGERGPDIRPVVGSRDGVLVVPGDLPSVDVRTCRRCMGMFRQQPDRIVVAAHAGRRGHPIVFPCAFAREIERLTAGLNTLLDRRTDSVVHAEVDDPGACRDVDTPEDYDALTEDVSRDAWDEADRPA
ncbi:MAG: nucleotidyltransferase family protein [Planctomycetota bacterium]|nr:MAG: nucleotidyltransferase family protein [Planctomycetota bacterium]